MRFERIGGYQVTALIGEGGMGQVYQATDTKLNRQVALKILPEAFATDPDRLARFQREAQVLASLNHPNIAQIYGLEESEGTRADGTQVVFQDTGGEIWVLDPAGSGTTTWIIQSARRASPMAAPWPMAIGGNDRHTPWLLRSCIPRATANSQPMAGLMPW